MTTASDANAAVVEARYIRFEPMEVGAGRKTGRWAVVSKSQGSTLGWIRWGMWARYCYFPAEETLYDALCLRDIAAFCDAQTRRYKAERQADRGR